MKRIMIIGASSGIGCALAKLFSKKGYALLLVARRLSLLEGLNLPITICKKADVANYDEIQAIINGLNDDEQIVGLINCAGILRIGVFDEMHVSSDHEQIDINFKGIVNVCKAILPHMKKHQDGTVINISTLNQMTSPSSAVYCATKDALKSLTLSLRAQYAADGIRVSLIEPLFIDTPIRDGLASPYMDSLIEKQQAITANELANIILFMFEQPKHINIRDLIVSPSVSTL
jgi:NADP-dependent 3-hydroxy acid dehydrogenase YdfG